jgi:hypothetical protein
MLRQHFFDGLALLGEFFHLFFELSDREKGVAALLIFGFVLLNDFGVFFGAFGLELRFLFFGMFLFDFLLLYFFRDDDSGFGLEEGFGEFAGSVFGDFGMLVMGMMLTFRHG